MLKSLSRGRREKSHRSLRIYILLVPSLWAIFVVMFLFQFLDYKEKTVQQKFDADVGSFVSQLEKRLQTNDAILAGFSSFLSVLKEDDLASADQYSKSIIETFPQIYMMEIARKVSQSEKPDAGRHLRAMLRHDFKYKDFSVLSGGATSPPSMVYWPIVYMNPSIQDAQDIYGVRLETVGYASLALELADKSDMLWATPAFDLIEGGRGYLLIKGARRKIPKSTQSTSILFGERMMALILIKADRLFLASGDGSIVGIAPDTSLTATLVGPNNIRTSLLQVRSNVTKTLPDLVALELERKLVVNSVSQPIEISFQRRVLLSGLLDREARLFVAAILLSSLVIVTVALLSYRLLSQVESEHLTVRYLAAHDSLTGLATRSALTQAFDGLLEQHRKTGQTLAVLSIDLDRFKPVNDTYGHAAGDAVLVEVARRISLILRTTDIVGRNTTVSRFGGDEFVILLGSLAHETDVRRVAERLRDEIGRPMQWSGHEIEVRCSIGIALCPMHGDTLEELLKSADGAMYRSKTDGKNQVVLSS